MRLQVVLQLVLLLGTLQGLFCQRSTADEEVSGKIYNGVLLLLVLLLVVG